MSCLKPVNKTTTMCVHQVEGIVSLTVTLKRSVTHGWLCVLHGVLDGRSRNGMQGSHTRL